MRKVGNVEPYLSYDKLRRTGKLLRGLKVRRTVAGRKTAIELYTNVPYAEEHETGRNTGKVTIKKPYVHNGAEGVITGGQVHARPHMKPSAQVLRAPLKLLQAKMRSFGW